MAAAAVMAHLYLHLVGRFPKSRVRFHDLSSLAFHNNKNISSKNITIIKLWLFSELQVCTQVGLAEFPPREEIKFQEACDL